jgi:MFS family permease
VRSLRHPDPSAVGVAAVPLAEVEPVTPPARVRLVTPRFVVLGVSNLSYFIANAMLLPTLPRYVTRELGSGSLGVGLAFGVYALGALIARPWSGRLGDRFGRRAVLATGSGLFAFTVLLYAPSGELGGLALLIFIRLLSGAFGAAVYVSATTAATEMAPSERRGEAISLFTVSVFVGIALGPLFGEEILKTTGSFTWVWIGSAAFGVSALLCGLLVPETRPRGHRSASSGRLLHPAAVRPGTLLCLGAVGLSTFSAFVAVYLDSLGLHDAAPVLLVFACVTVLSRLFGARLNDRVPRQAMATWSLVMSGLALVVMAVWPDPAAVYTAAVLLAAGMSFMYPTFVLMAVDAAPAPERGAVVGTVTAFADLSYAVAALALGVVADAVSYRGAFAGAAAFVGLALVLLLAGVARTRPRHAVAVSSA